MARMIFFIDPQGCDAYVNPFDVSAVTNNTPRLGPTQSLIALRGGKCLFVAGLPGEVIKKLGLKVGPT